MFSPSLFPINFKATKGIQSTNGIKKAQVKPQKKNSTAILSFF
jgi:hypothetical protein